MIDLDKIVGFDWDAGNRRKSADKHGVTHIESEQVFDDENVMFLKDMRHSEKEQRYQALGRTKRGRHLIVTFTMRRGGTFIRIISAREMSGKERGCYD